MASRAKRTRTPLSAAPARDIARKPDQHSADAAHVGALYHQIYAVVRTIPRGAVLTYGQVAELAGMPGAARVVGAAMRACVPELALPWYRVVGKRSATMAGVSIHDPVGAGIQRAILEEEGVVFTESGGIALARYGWLPGSPGSGTQRRAQRKSQAASKPRATARKRAPTGKR